jgi:ferrous iron transport protein B
MNPALDTKTPLITLVGPPNSGKTTLFNYLSGNNYKTVNYPGATVEYSLGKFHSKFLIDANLLDSPGIVSLVPNSPDEEIAINSLYSHPEFGHPHLAVVTIDSSQLSRHLLLVKQLHQSNFRIIIVLTMIDILHRKNLDIDAEKLGKLFDCDAVKIDGRTGAGIETLVSKIESHFKFNKSDNDNKLQKIDFNQGTDELIKTFKEIEDVESKVLTSLRNSINHIDLKKANSQLKILGSSISRSDSHKIDERTLKIDKILLHKIWGLAAFFIVMTLTFTSIFWLADPLINLVDSFFGIISNESLKIFGTGWVGDLIANGIISGTGSILVFVPQILILFLILGLLEDTGYLARGAMLIDKPLSKIGLNGKSFVPMLSGFACAIPAILATRTIPNRRERMLTIFILPLMSCSARLPVYALLIAFVLPSDKTWLGGFMLASIYIFSIISSVIIAGIINKMRSKLIKTDDSSSFILELPAYRVPKLKVVLHNTYTSTLTYLKKAGPVILALSLILWVLTTFPNINPEIDKKGLTDEEILNAIKIERLSTSYAADLGKLIQPVMTPIGMDWRIGVSLIAAFAAREVFVSSLALIFKVTSDESTLQQSIVGAMRNATISGTDQKLFTTSTIIGLIIYFIFAMQCISTIAVSKKESGGWRIPIFQIAIFTIGAYILTLITVNGLRFFGLE